MILRGGQRQRVFAVAQGEERGFLALHELFDDDLGAGFAKTAAEHHVDRRKRFLVRHRHDDAFSGGEPVGLDDDRSALFADVGLRLIRVGEVFVRRGRNMIRAAQRLGEFLRAFQLARGLCRSECLEAGRVEIVDDARRDRRIRTDHDEIHRVTPAEIDHRGMVGDIERHAFGFPRDAGIARRAPELCHQRGSCDLPGQGVFAAAGTEQKYLHEMQPDDGTRSRVGRTSLPLPARGMFGCRHSGRRAMRADPESRNCLALVSSRFRVRCFRIAPE